MNGRRTATLPVVLAAVLVLGACATSGGGDGPSAFQRHYEAGRDSAAAALFASDSALHRDAGVLFRAGLLFADPASPVYRPSAARTQFERLLALDPTPERERAARIYLELLERTDRLARQLEGLKEVDLDRPSADTTGLR